MDKIVKKMMHRSMCSQNANTLANCTTNNAIDETLRSTQATLPQTAAQQTTFASLIAKCTLR
jgi:hypothetical protein